MTQPAHLFGDWDTLNAMLRDDRFKREFKQHVRRANTRIGLRFVRMARQNIQRERFDPNSELTQILKGSSKALVDGGDLLGSIAYAHDPNDPRAVWVGTNRRAAGGVNIAKLLHDGFFIKSTPKSRAFLFAKLNEIADRGGSRGAAAQAFLARLQSSNPHRGTGTGRLAGNSQAKKRARAYYFARVRPPTPSGPATRYIRVPARPFVGTVLADPAFVQGAIRDWRKAFADALGRPV